MYPKAQKLDTPTSKIRLREQTDKDEKIAIMFERLAV